MEKKCCICGKYEVRKKEFKSIKIFDDLEFVAIHMWKWCKLHNNWCRHISGNCDAIIEPQNKIVGNNRGLLQEEEK